MPNEIVRIVAHEKFILDGMRRQAGTVDKAVLELVMNGMEAQLPLKSKRPRVDIVFKDDEKDPTLTVTDPGRGFQSRAEVNEWFAKFGTPHDECPNCQATMAWDGERYHCDCGHEAEGRTWAEFRVGRGQALSQGRNVWRTGIFRMEYDLETPPDQRTYSRKDGTDHILDFALVTDLPHHAGCEVTIHFYNNPVGPGKFYSNIDAFRDAIQHQVEFMEGIVTFNGEQINTPASECSWDLETDDAYFMFGKGVHFSAYNIGAFVKDFSVSSAGINGVFVSKRRMHVNYARNDIHQTCAVFKRIWKVIQIHKTEKVRKERRYLTSEERISTLLDVRYGNVEYDEIKSLGLLQLTDGRMLSLDAARRLRVPWTFAPMGDRAADHLMQTGQATCLATDVLDRFKYPGDPKQFFIWLMRHLIRDSYTGQYQWSKIEPFFRKFEDISRNISLSGTIIPASELQKAERRFLRVMRGYNIWGNRTLCIGLSQSMLGWTDGSSFIAFEREHLRINYPSYARGAATIATLAMHELAHNDNDTGTHIHGTEFYQRYHELTQGPALWIIEDLPRRLRNERYQEKKTERVEKITKKKAQRDKKLKIAKVKAKQKRNPVVVAAETEKKPVAAKKATPKFGRRRRRF